jgi:hypothetical protein
MVSGIARAATALGAATFGAGFLLGFAMAMGFAFGLDFGVAGAFFAAAFEGTAVFLLAGFLALAGAGALPFDFAAGAFLAMGPILQWVSEK